MKLLFVLTRLKLDYAKSAILEYFALVLAISAELSPAAGY